MKVIKTIAAATILLTVYCGETMSEEKNRLAESQSPYLLQHAHNPVDWYPWGEEAFEKARKEDKPIFLSIGYSTCHWCHVMAHESFEDADVAGLMNRAFVSVKVDREERPDIDGIYMTVCQMVTGRGGWPLTIIMTPDQKPFFAATYIPKESRFGRTGMMELIPKIEKIWKEQRGEIMTSADKITEALQQSAAPGKGAGLDEGVLELAFEQLSGRFDAQLGGFSQAPKFPTPHNLLFLLRYHRRSGDRSALEMVTKTLDEMRFGGIYDHLGFGFHRYSTDREWLVPHFEKMLYDQAQLAMTYLEAYQVTGNEAYAATAREIFTYVLRDMTSPEGGFYSAEDADSEGVEGKFYVWTEKEIREVLGEEEAELAIRTFGVTREGNFLEEATGEKTGDCILHLDEALEPRIEAAREKLFAHREKRVHPYKDDKILTDWNGLMIAAFAKGAAVFDEPVYAEAAGAAAAFILEKMRTPEGRLLHRYRNGQAGIDAHVDDYAFFIHGLLNLYEATFDTAYLDSALTLNSDMIERFWDASGGGFHFTAGDAEPLLIRTKEIDDGAVPSGNSVNMLNLLRLSRITGQAELEQMASTIGTVFSDNVSRWPVAFTQLLVALDFAYSPSREVVIAGKAGAGDTKAMISALRGRFMPNTVVLFRPEGEAPPITRIAAFTRDQVALGETATAYVCSGFVCERPTTDPEKMLELLFEK